MAGSFLFFRNVVKDNLLLTSFRVKVEPPKGRTFGAQRTARAATAYGQKGQTMSEQKNRGRALVEELVNAYRSMSKKTAQESRDEQKTMLTAVKELCDLAESRDILLERGDGSIEEEVVVGLLREAINLHNLSQCPEDELNLGNEDEERIKPEDLKKEAEFLMDAALAVSMTHTLGGFWKAKLADRETDSEAQ